MLLKSHFSNGDVLIPRYHERDFFSWYHSRVKGKAANKLDPQFVDKMHTFNMLSKAHLKQTLFNTKETAAKSIE